MYRLIFGYSFDELVATILLLGLTLYFLNKKKASLCGNAEDADPGASSSFTVLTETNFGGSSSSATETNHGASSSLTASTGNCYEVFLSFRGLDTREGFADHLYNGLRDAGIDAFRDDDELPPGENIRPELLAAIRNSKILIPILSVNYGTSSWCLDELVQIMECKNNHGHIVLPIFYKVKPADVRHQIGSFGDEFHKRERRLRKRSSFDPTILDKWKKALDEVSTLKAYEAKGFEATFVKSIVQEVLNKLKKKFELVISENLVGIDSHVKEVMDFMDNKSHATLFVGIHGMGGIGKTTFAKAIYNKLSNQFKHRSFLADIRESRKRNGIHYLQNKLIYDIFERENAVRDRDEGTNYISSKFEGKKVLVLLDDVDDVDQLKCLAGHRDWFYPGSRIIITTRNKKILKQFGVDYTYGHKEMDDVHSLILFSKHAFRRDSPLREFKDLSYEVVSITKGLPLSLEVLGSLLCGEKLEFWRGTIDKLKEEPRKEVQETLKISYEALDYKQQQIFLDIACFFIGTDSRIASYMWDACGFFAKEGIRVLRFMSLIKIGDNYELQMHDQLRDLGRAIVREENRREFQKRSRLWNHKEVLKVLKQNKGTEKIEAINLSEGNLKGFGKIAKQDRDIYTAKQFKNLTSLRFFCLKRAHLRGDFKDSMEELRWLRWQDCPMNFEVSNFNVKELAVLDLSSNNYLWEWPKSEINEKWEGWRFFKMAEKLKYLDLSGCDSLEDTDFLSAFKELEVLILNWCRRLKRIDASIGDMEALLRLELEGCRSLTELPAEIGKLKALQVLILNWCRRLKRIDASIGDMEALLRLELSWCVSLTELPAEIGKLKALQVLLLNGCGGLKRIDASIGDMKALLRLKLSSCKSLTELPAEIGKLQALQQLDLNWTSSLSALPDSIGYLENLEILEISLSGIEELPNGIGTLRNLRELRVSSCTNLKRIMAESTCNLSSLQHLDFHNCAELQSLPDLPSGLTYLDVTCQSRKLPSLSCLCHLKELRVRGCNFLECIQELPSTLIKNSECSQSTDVEELESPQSLNSPSKLEMLNVDQCTFIKTVDVSQFIHLRKLSVSNCQNLLEVRGLDKSIYLESLIVRNCDSIKRLDLPKSEALKKLDAEFCKKLVEIHGLDRLEYLESLYIGGCTSIERLDLSKSRKLKQLRAAGCKNLAEIQGLDRSEFLERLCISWCTSIERLLLPKSESLNILEAQDCKKLAEIQGLDRLEFLKELNIIGCKSLKTIPELSGTRIYQYYQLTDSKMSRFRIAYMDDLDESI